MDKRFTYFHEKGKKVATEFGNDEGIPESFRVNKAAFWVVCSIHKMLAGMSSDLRKIAQAVDPELRDKKLESERRLAAVRLRYRAKDYARERLKATGFSSLDRRFLNYAAKAIAWDAVPEYGTPPSDEEVRVTINDTIAGGRWSELAVGPKTRIALEEASALATDDSSEESLPPDGS